MATSVVMPALEMAQETGRLLAWRRREGETVTKGEPLMEVETDKAVVEVEAESSGILAAVKAHEGDVIAVGQTIAWIVAPGEEVPVDERPRVGGRAATGPAALPGPSSSAPSTAGRADERPLASPRARRLAAEQGLDLRSVAGSGPGGTVRSADLPAGQSPRDETPTTIWRLMAERVTAAWTSVPQFVVTRDVNASALVALRTQLADRSQAESGGDVTYTDLLVALTARVIARHPRLNASWVDGRLQHHDRINMGVATAVEQGLVVPVIQGAGLMSVPDIARRRRELVERARAGRLLPADLAGGTFTISNLGMYGVDAFTAIVNAPQAAILAVGRIADRVVAHEGRVEVRPQMTLTLTCDHRVADGARAGAFMHDLAVAIEQPERVG